MTVTPAGAPEREKTGLELYKWIDKIQELNVGEITVTDIMREGRRKGFNIDLYKDLRKRVNTQLVAHGGAGSFNDIKKLFVETDVDAVSISSLFHYNYLEKIKDKKIQGSTVFINSVDNVSKNENLIKDLKIYLNENGVPVRI